MIRMQHWDAATPPREVLRMDTFQGHVANLVGTRDTVVAAAQGFLVEQDPDWVTPTHFHREHQFQVIVAGGGTIGRHAVAPLHVHYAAAETGYGPITAGPQGISYLTLRAVSDVGAQYLHKPGVRESMRAGMKREQQHGTPTGEMTAQPLSALSDPVSYPLITPRDDGLAAHFVRVPPNQSLPVPAAHPHGGRFHVVTRGAMQVEGKALAAWAVLFTSAEEALAIDAGPEGAEVLVLQYPNDAQSVGVAGALTKAGTNP